MTIKELDAYIKDYTKNDKTNRAIMLTAPWGSGKTYYIKNELIPSLKKMGLVRFSFHYMELTVWRNLVKTYILKQERNG